MSSDFQKKIAQVADLKERVLALEATRARWSVSAAKNRAAHQAGRSRREAQAFIEAAQAHKSWDDVLLPAVRRLAKAMKDWGGAVPKPDRLGHICHDGVDGALAALGGGRAELVILSVEFLLDWQPDLYDQKGSADPDEHSRELRKQHATLRLQEAWLEAEWSAKDVTLEDTTPGDRNSGLCKAIFKPWGVALGDRLGERLVNAELEARRRKKAAA